MDVGSTVVPAETTVSGNVIPGRRRIWAVRLAVLGFAAVGVARVLIATARYGVGQTSWDAVWYLDVARNLQSGHGLVFHGGEPLVTWPPLYPVLLAVVGAVTRLDPEAFAHVVNAATFAVVVCLSGYLLWSGTKRSTTYTMLGTAAVLLSVPLAEVYSMAWSEGLFVLLILLHFLFADRYCRNSGLVPLILMTLAVSFACVTRYIGVALLPAGVLTILLVSRASARQRVVHAVAFAALSCLPLGLWLVRNHNLTGTFFGGRNPASTKLLGDMLLCAKTVLAWFFSGLGSVLLPAAGIAGLVAAAIVAGRRRETVSPAEGNWLRSSLPSLLFLFFYSVVLLVTSSMTNYDPIGDRLLSPVFIPLVLIVVGALSSLASSAKLMPSVMLRWFSTGLLIAWLCFPLVRVVRATAYKFEDGAGGYSTRAWHNSETIAFARQVLPQSTLPVYSNGPDVLWAIARVYANFPPYRAKVQPAELEGRWPPEQEAAFVQFENITWRPYLLSIEELSQAADVERIARFADGSVLLVTARPRTSP